ncbi:hypothetical protein BS50DRAFT_128493 [Corynespora cassiicola Philippines]|uniref:Uncharacterized protein n=1 Tax=Corynespora cassiicola Philippines TaxID=1448308 RepID=A0A2T2NBF1_CORCC|nr:hypothetical protein BS50DRAFT_128493 [Corynespora cassiicola Philippines]
MSISSYPCNERNSHIILSPFCIVLTFPNDICDLLYIITNQSIGDLYVARPKRPQSRTHHLRPTIETVASTLKPLSPPQTVHSTTPSHSYVRINN